VIADAKANAAIQANMKKAMSFIASLMELMAEKGKDALKLELPFNEKEVLEANLSYLSRSLKMKQVDIFPSTADAFGATAIPGEPVAHFYD
jgi:hypothetical protein